MQDLEDKGLQTFSVKGPIVNILGCVGHTVSTVTTQLCCCGVTAVISDMEMNECRCVPIKLYLQT